MDWQKILEFAQTKGLAALEHYGPKLLAALAIYVIGKWIARAIRGLVRKILLRARMDETLTGFLVNVLYGILMVVVIVSVLGQLGIPTGSFLAILGAAGLAVGFALQGSLANFAAGVMIIMFRPFKIGDFVEGGGVAGVVEEIHIFSTKMRTADNKQIIVPNSAMTGGNITNYSAKPTRRVDMVFGIGYGDDIKKAKETLTAIVKEHPKVLEDPAPQIVVAALADSSVNFNVRPWVKSADYWDVYFDIHEQVKLRFDELDITIPFPQRDVHLHQVA